MFLARSVLKFAFVHGTESYECRKVGDANGRILLIATCDTRSGYREFNAMKVWNVTGRGLRNDGISMMNVCRGRNWGMHGFLTKPLLYVNYLREHLSDPRASNIHAILMDSDTFWSAENANHVWKNYDCARNGKDLVVSTEMSCWVGRYCGQEDIDRWYKDTSIMPSYSPFVNSGVVMGKISEVVKMLDYVIVNNQSYYTTYGKKHKFDDQYAIADYAIKVAPQISALDYHQLISASCSIHAPGDPPDEGWPFLCKNRNGTLSFSCHIWNGPVRKQGHFAINKETCIAHRKVFSGMVLEEELRSLSSTPLVWHGNGAGKRQCIDLGFESFKCFLKKYSETEESLLQSWDN
jgi:hypothetical protein